MTDTPTIEVSAWRADRPDPIATVGPSASWDFEPLVQQLLQRPPIGRSHAPITGLKVVCSGTYGDSVPGLSLSRQTVGQLVALDAALELNHARRGRGASEPIGDLPRIRVDFTLETRHDHDPDDVTRLIGLTPSRVVRKGDMGVTGKPSTTMFWTLSTPELQAGSFEAPLDDLLSQLRPRTRSISALTTDQVDGVLSLLGHVRDGAPRVLLTAEQLRLIWQLGLQIDVDLLT